MNLRKMEKDIKTIKLTIEDLWELMNNQKLDREDYLFLLVDNKGYT